ncbi:hypothetical protein ACI6Q2_15355 [Chitinophagaceae bacterium LWZ2-11]
MIKFFTSTLIFILSYTNIYAQQNSLVRDYLNVPGPIQFDKTSWHLNWSSHPYNNYYKQEYLMEGDDSAKFKKMIIIDCLIGRMTVKDVVAQKIYELKKLKKNNPVIQYQIFEKDGEYLVDFLLSADSSRASNIIERNIYRYQAIKDKDKTGVLLFGLCERAYDSEITPFLISLKDNLQADENEVGKFQIPAIKILEK